MIITIRYSYVQEILSSFISNLNIMLNAFKNVFIETNAYNTIPTYISVIKFIGTEMKSNSCVLYTAFIKKKKIYYTLYIFRKYEPFKI